MSQSGTQGGKIVGKELFQSFAAPLEFFGEIFIYFRFRVISEAGIFFAEFRHTVTDGDLPFHNIFQKIHGAVDIAHVVEHPVALEVKFDDIGTGTEVAVESFDEHGIHLSCLVAFELRDEFLQLFPSLVPRIGKAPGQHGQFGKIKVVEKFPYGIACGFIVGFPGAGHFPQDALQVERPHSAVVHGTVVLELIPQRILHVSPGERCPHLCHFCGTGTPFGSRQPGKKLFFTGGKVFVCKSSGGTVHGAGVVAEVPALDNVTDTVAAHLLILAVEQSRSRNKGDGCNLMGASHLQLGGKGAFAPGGFSHSAETVGGTDTGKPVVAPHTDFAQLVFGAAGFKVVGKDDIF